jgi:hypothetical protein
MLEIKWQTRFITVSEIWSSSERRTVNEFPQYHVCLHSLVQTIYQTEGKSEIHHYWGVDSPFSDDSLQINSFLRFTQHRGINRGVDLCQTLGEPNPFPPDPYPLPSFPSLPFLRSLPSLCPPFPSLPSPSSPLPSPGGPGAMPPENFFRYTCSHASFSAFLTQKSAVYLTRFPDNNFAFLQ